jgi:hypothetical protein
MNFQLRELLIIPASPETDELQNLLEATARAKNEVAQYAEAVAEAAPEMGPVEIAAQIAFVYLSPVQLFEVFFQSLIHWLRSWQK